MKGVLHLQGSARKLDYTATVAHLHLLKSLSVQPISYLLDVAVRGTKLSSKLLRRQPPVVKGRRFVLLVVEKPLQDGVLFGASPENKEHAI